MIKCIFVPHCSRTQTVAAAVAAGASHFAWFMFCVDVIVVMFVDKPPNARALVQIIYIENSGVLS